MPIVNGLEDEYAGKIQFVRVNIHKPENEPLLEKFGFTTSPELHLVDEQGKTLGAWGEGVTREELVKAFDEATHD